MVVETTINYDLQPLLREASRPPVCCHKSVGVGELALQVRMFYVGRLRRL